jgi:hypothetical protein
MLGVLLSQYLEMYGLTMMKYLMHHAAVVKTSKRFHFTYREK